VANAASIHSIYGVCSRIARGCSQFKWTSARYIPSMNGVKLSVALGVHNIIPTFNRDSKYYTSGFILPCDQVQRLLMEALYLTKWHLRKRSFWSVHLDEAATQSCSGTFITYSVDSTTLQQQQTLQCMSKRLRRLSLSKKVDNSAYPIGISPT
jgi:hypothetical protein